jgi:flap endonuclease-1
MGVNGFLSFLKDKYPQVVHSEHLSKFAFQRLFIDISAYLYKYIVSYGRENNKWLNAMVHLALLFKENRVQFVPVFDGKPPDEKGDEINERKEKREEGNKRIQSLSDALDQYHTNNLSTESIAILKKELESAERKGYKTQRLLLTSNQPSSDEIFSKNDIKILTSCLDGLKKQIVKITEKDLNDLKTIFTTLGINWLQAEGESEGYCCWLAKQGYGVGIVSGDSDCIIHGVPIFINNLESDGSLNYYLPKEICEVLELTETQLIDFAILLGCDYNRHLKNNKFGPVNGLKMLKEYGSIENCPNKRENEKIGLDKDCLLVETCRKCFNPTYSHEDVHLPFIEQDEYDIQQLNSKFNISERLLQKWCNPLNKPGINFSDQN